MINHPDLPLAVYQMTSVFTEAYVKAATSWFAVKGFEVTGKCMSNNDVYLFNSFPATIVEVFLP
jgi:hypothetical protein